MARSKKSNRETEIAKDDSPQEVSSPETASATIPRLNLPLTEDGLRVDWERVRPSNRAKFASLMATDPQARSVAGFNTDTEQAVDVDLFGGITQENVKAGLDAVNQLTAIAFRMLVPRIAKHPLKKDAKGAPLPLTLDADLLFKTFVLSDAQHAELDPRATKIAQKHGKKLPEWLQKNLDLYMLVGMYLRYSVENAQLVIKAQFTRDFDIATRTAASRRVVVPTAKPDTDAGLQPPGNGQSSDTTRP